MESQLKKEFVDEFEKQLNIIKGKKIVLGHPSGYRNTDEELLDVYNILKNEVYEALSVETLKSFIKDAIHRVKTEDNSNLYNSPYFNESDKLYFHHFMSNNHNMYYIFPGIIEVNNNQLVLSPKIALKLYREMQKRRGYEWISLCDNTSDYSDEQAIKIFENTEIQIYNFFWENFNRDFLERKVIAEYFQDYILRDSLFDYRYEDYYDIKIFGMFRNCEYVVDADEVYINYEIYVKDTGISVTDSFCKMPYLYYNEHKDDEAFLKEFIKEHELIYKPHYKSATNFMQYLVFESIGELDDGIGRVIFYPDTFSSFEMRHFDCDNLKVSLRKFYDEVIGMNLIGETDDKSTPIDFDWVFEDFFTGKISYEKLIDYEDDYEYGMYCFSDIVTFFNFLGDKPTIYKYKRSQ